MGKEMDLIEYNIKGGKFLGIFNNYQFIKNDIILDE